MEEAVTKETKRIEANQAYLSQAAELFGKDEAQDPNQIRDFIYNLIKIQFQYPEHFIRELIQNSAAATKTIALEKSEKSLNATDLDFEGLSIDVYVDREKGIVRVEDNGIGMTQEVMEGVYFNLGKSLNEALKHAAGKFGIGAVSCYGLNHDYVAVDSKPREGLGGLAIVDSNLQRDDFMPTTRGENGTTVEIKLSAKSTIDWDRIVQILKEDCCYVETPVYLHMNGKSEKINKPLFPDTPNTIIFDEDLVQGHLTKTDEGVVELLSHRIKLSEIKSIGYEGAANCDGFNTIFSRDTVVNDPVLKYVLGYIRHKVTELRHNGEIDIKKLSIEARLADYRGFVYNTLFNQDGTPNEKWLLLNLKDFERDLDFEPDIRILDKATLLSGVSLGILGFAAGFPDAVLASCFGLEGLTLGVLGAKALEDKINEQIVRHHSKKYFMKCNAVIETRSLFEKAAIGTVKTLLPTATMVLAGVGLYNTIITISSLSEATDIASKHYIASQIAQTMQYTDPSSSLCLGIGAGLAAGGLGLWINHRKKGNLFMPYNEPLNEEQERFLDEVKSELMGYGLPKEVEVVYSWNLKPDQGRCVVRKNEIALNRYEEYPAWVPVLLYATNVLKDSKKAWTITSNHKGDKL
ncbi:ATP-binding protein [Candidatus Woesearchaeota archaeon]|nr:ATP-binding protein [Candidatus Woesearchaeota archaeon]